MGSKRVTPVLVIAAAVALLASGLAFARFSASALGQAATPAASPAAESALHPAHIHRGTCASVGEIIFPLDDVVAPGAPATMMGTPVAAPRAATPVAAEASPVAAQGPIAGMSTTVVKVSLANLISGNHVINVHESLANIQTYIACGQIAGNPTDGRLMVPLDELNGSGFAGEAVLTDNGGKSVTVAITLYRRPV